jgi:DNA-binding GntR family transcriptional regulator
LLGWEVRSRETLKSAVQSPLFQSAVKEHTAIVALLAEGRGEEAGLMLRTHTEAFVPKLDRTRRPAR